MKRTIAPDDFKPATAPELGTCEYRVRIALRLPPAAAALLKATAAAHYDGTVRSYAEAGPINGIFNCSTYSDHGFPLDFRDADIATKALEQARPTTAEEAAMVFTLRAALVELKARILKRTEELYAQDGTR